MNEALADAGLLIHGKLYDDTRCCPAAEAAGFATTFLSAVTCPDCRARMLEADASQVELTGSPRRLEHHRVAVKLGAGPRLASVSSCDLEVSCSCGRVLLQVDGSEFDWAEASRLVSEHLALVGVA